MKKINLGRKTITVSNEAVAAAYCGAYSAGHYAAIGYVIMDLPESFKFLYEYYITRMRGIVKEMPSKMSLRKFLEYAPANAWLDMND